MKIVRPIDIAPGVGWVLLLASTFTGRVEFAYLALGCLTLPVCLSIYMIAKDIREGRAYK